MTKILIGISGFFLGLSAVVIVGAAGNYPAFQFGLNQPAFYQKGNSMLGITTHYQFMEDAISVDQNHSVRFLGQVPAGANQEVFTFANTAGPVAIGRYLASFRGNVKADTINLAGAAPASCTDATRGTLQYAGNALQVCTPDGWRKVSLEP